MAAFTTPLLVLEGKEGVKRCLSIPACQLAAFLLYHPCKFYCQVFMQSRKASLSDAESTPLLMLKCDNRVSEQNVLAGLSLCTGTK